MISFFIGAGLLLIGALLFVVPPLLGKRLRKGDVSHDETNLIIYRDQIRELDTDLANGTLGKSQYEAAKQEIERRVLEDVEEGEDNGAHPGASGNPLWTLAAIIAVLVPLVSISLYLTVGTPAALDPEKVAAQFDDGGHDMSPQRLAKLIDGLNDRLRSNPDDVENWMMLAKTTQAVGKYDESVKAYREIIRRIPPDAQLLADFADTLAMANGRTLEGEPEQVIAQALLVDPQNVKALALGGTVAFQRQDYAKAAQLWRRILAVVPPESEFAQRMVGSIQEAESRAGIKHPEAKAAQAPGKAPQAASGASLRGKVELDQAVAKTVSPGDTVFIFARAANGPKMPLAILRKTVADLPLSFELTEAMAMAPGMSISQFPDLVVGARVSKSGNATPKTGDWESALVPVRVGASGISLVISRFVR